MAIEKKLFLTKVGDSCGECGHNLVEVTSVNSTRDGVLLCEWCEGEELEIVAARFFED